MNMRRTTAMGLGAAVAVSAGLVVAAIASAAAFSLSATMTPKQVVTPKGRAWVVPAAVKAARGAFTGKLAADGRTLTWKITYSKVPGSVIADVHLGHPGKFGGILGRLCTACKSGQKGRLKLKRNYAAQFRLKNTWVTLITPRYPNGVVRGQLKPR